ncbi:hypothetical protein [Amycolatopsis anabasis]|uniref:hypothetical protein n=1 Tax=Amycolatopsis anabasis TaxID=1840409 RepID=UPI00131E751B|nr:hypothetical protein [Amycolatopsis anabasis]
MAALERVTLDRAGVAEILKSAEFDAIIRELAKKVGEIARSGGHRVTSGEPLPIDVYSDPNRDRAGWTVAIRHPAGVGMEARYGVLARAAGSSGLEVNGGAQPGDET